MLSPRQVKELRTAAPSPNRVQKALDLAGVTHAQLADAISATQPHVTEIVNGNYSRLPLETARNVATFFGCAIEDLFPAAEAVA